MMPARRRRWAVAFSILAVVYALAMTFGGVADRMVLWPSTKPLDAGPAVPRTILLNDKRIEIWTARSPAAASKEIEGYVLEFCGNATRAEQIAQYVADRWKKYPVEAWVMNYPGYGQSEGGAHLSLIPPAALAAYDELNKLAHGRPIYVEANSLGTAPALYVAANRPVAGLVLQNPPPLHRLILHKHGWWNLWLLAAPVALQIPNELDSIYNAAHVTAPAVFLMADHDTLVPPAYQRLVLDAYAGPKHVIDMKGVTHWQSVTGDPQTQLLGEIDRLWRASH